MAGGVKELKKDEILFREGDASDAMYVIKSGRIAITKSKGSNEIILAELVAGEMLGEMAFFDNKPRSAGAKALIPSQVIALPFSSLHAQFKTFPEWLKAMVRTINSHLRSANQRIKNLESAEKDDQETFPPHLITRLCAIISLIGYKAGEKTEEGVVIPAGMLRNYTIQIFQQPTHKMQKLMDALNGLGIMKVEDLGEGRQKLTILKHQLLSDFTDWYNKWLFTEESKKITIEEKELPVMRALVHYGKQLTPNNKGEVTLNLTDVKNRSMADLNYLVDVNAADSLTEKGLTGDKQSGEGGMLTITFKVEDISSTLPYWEIIYTLKKITGR